MEVPSPRQEKLQPGCGLVRLDFTLAISSGIVENCVYFDAISHENEFE